MTKPTTVPAFRLKSLKDGERPTFELPVTFALRDGTQAQITLTCKAPRKTEWAAMKDAYYARATAQAQDLEKARKDQADLAAARDATVRDPASTPADSPPSTFLHDLACMRLDNDAALVAEIATGWDLSDTFGLPAIKEFEERYPGALESAIHAIDGALSGSRLGNSGR